MKPVVFHPEAIQELDDAVAYYAERSFKAASAFEGAVEAGVHSVAQHPSRQAFLRNTGKRAFRLAGFLISSSTRSFTTASGLTPLLMSAAIPTIGRTESPKIRNSGSGCDPFQNRTRR